MRKKNSTSWFFQKMFFNYCFIVGQIYNIADFLIPPSPISRLPNKYRLILKLRLSPEICTRYQNIHLLLNFSQIIIILIFSIPFRQFIKSRCAEIFKNNGGGGGTSSPPRSLPNQSLDTIWELQLVYNIIFFKCNFLIKLIYFLL